MAYRSNVTIKFRESSITDGWITDSVLIALLCAPLGKFSKFAYGGRWMIRHFSIIKSILFSEYHCVFSISCKITPYYVINIVFWLSSDRPPGLFFRARFIFFPYSRLSSVCLRLSHCLISFLLFPCISCPYPIAILNGTSSFLSLVQENINMPSGHYYMPCSWSGCSKTI